MPLPLTVSCFSKIQIAFTFLVPDHPDRPGQRAVKWMCVCSLMHFSGGEQLLPMWRIWSPPIMWFLGPTESSSQSSLPFFYSYTLPILYSGQNCPIIWESMLPPSMCFVCFIRVHNPSSASITSVVFACSCSAFIFIYLTFILYYLVYIYSDLTVQ